MLNLAYLASITVAVLTMVASLVARPLGYPRYADILASIGLGTVVAILILGLIDLTLRFRRERSTVTLDVWTPEEVLWASFFNWPRDWYRPGEKLIQISGDLMGTVYRLSRQRDGSWRLATFRYDDTIPVLLHLQVLPPEQDPRPILYLNPNLHHFFQLSKKEPCHTRT